jgi:alpha-beta hydrolase superfamily lysophospholipase
VPTLILHGDDDQIVPIGAAAMLSSKIVKGATLKIYKGAPHGMCSTLKDRVNEELLAFLGKPTQPTQPTRQSPLTKADPGKKSARPASKR